MAEENETRDTSDVGEPTVMPTAFEIFDENYKPNPRLLGRRIN